VKRRIFGLENEYGLTCTLNGQRRLSPDNVARYLFEKVIPGARNANVFLENGARLYLDTGFHPEYATPECDDVTELVIHDKAGERIVEDLLHQAEKRLREDGISGNILLFKNNTDSAGNSYGCHENYLVSRDVSFQRLAEALIPFFVTRQIVAGAGKVLQTPRGFHYCLSQRAQHICQEISGATTSSRSIINTRDEPHADAERYRRLHVIVGDSNMSEVATYLKIGTTALVLDMIEDGFFDRDYSLQSPVQAIRDISHDPTLKEAIKLKDGRTITALQMQLEYLEYATRYVDSISPDPATKDVLARWTDVLGKLETDPMQLSRELDWVIKRQLIENYMNRHRLTWRDPKVSSSTFSTTTSGPTRASTTAWLPTTTWTESPMTRPSSRPSTCRPRPRARGSAASSSGRPTSRARTTGWTGCTSSSTTPSARRSSARTRSSPTTNGSSA